MKKFTFLFIPFLFSIFIITEFAEAQSNAALHITRKGKEYFYKSSNGGFETITNIPMTTLRCMRCHPGTLANGTPIDTATYQPSCNDCHNFAVGTAVPDSICKKCHSRQKVEIASFTDKHRSAGLFCTTCHIKEELHFDATNSNTMFDTTIGKTCQTVGCHNNLPVTPDDSLAHVTHISKLECASCHARSEVTCYNCHFETEIWSGMRGFKRFIGPIKNFIILGRLPKHNNKVGLVNYQSLVYNGQSFMGYGPYYAHTIMPKDSTRSCSGCHNNAIINELNTTGFIQMARFDSTSNPRIIHAQGVIPIPPNYNSVFKFDFANYYGRVDTTVTDPTKWSFMKSGLNGHQMLSEYVLPLTSQQMQTLGATIGIKPIGGEVPRDYTLHQNYPNPFNPSTVIRFSIPKATYVNIKVYNLLGKEVETLLSKKMDAGTYEVDFTASGLDSGVYFYRLSTPDFTKTMKMMYLK